MNKGGIRAIGTAAELKSRFGNGFKLTLTCPDPANTQPAIEYTLLLLNQSQASLPHIANHLALCSGSSRSWCLVHRSSTTSVARSTFTCPRR
jgi:hypothetical protein